MKRRFLFHILLLLFISTPLRSDRKWVIVDTFAEMQQAHDDAVRDAKKHASFPKRDIMPMKPCPDCNTTGILAFNGMFGYPRCQYYFA